MTTEPTEAAAVAVPLDAPVRPYATSVTWRNSEGGSWQQWHDDEDPVPIEWGDRPPDEVVHVYTAAQVAYLLAAERERHASRLRLAADRVDDIADHAKPDTCFALRTLAAELRA